MATTKVTFTLDEVAGSARAGAGGVHAWAPCPGRAARLLASRCPRGARRPERVAHLPLIWGSPISRDSSPAATRSRCRAASSPARTSTKGLDVAGVEPEPGREPRRPVAGPRDAPGGVDLEPFARVQNEALGGEIGERAHQLGARVAAGGDTIEDPGGRVRRVRARPSRSELRRCTRPPSPPS